MYGSRRKSWRGKSMPWAVVALVTLVAIVGSAASAFGQTTTSTATGGTTLPPAPAGFADQVVGVYQSEYSTAEVLGRSDALAPPAQFQQALSQLTADQLAPLYAATQQNPEFQQIPALMQAIAADMAGKSVKLSSATSGVASPAAQLMSMVTPAASASAVPATLLEGEPVQPFTPEQCSDGPSSASIFAALIVLDVAIGTFNILIPIQAAIPEGFPEIIFKILLAPVEALVAALILAAAIVHDTLAYLKKLADECSSSNLKGYIENIDNTTAQTYRLMSEITAGVADLKEKGLATLTGIDNVQTSLVTMQQSLEQTLATDTQTLQTTIGSGSQSLTANLQTIQTGLQQGVTAVQNTESTNGQQVIGEVDKSTSTLQASVSSTLQQVLQETDTTAQGLTNLVTKSNQQIMNTLQANFATTQSQYYADLKRRIERALSSGVPQVQFKLPASMGGFLNSTPVGVTEVVNDDLHALQALKVVIQPGIVANVNAGNAAVAAGQWLSAYANFAKAYQAFAYA